MCDEVLAAKPTDDATLSAMMHVLRTLGRRMYYSTLPLKLLALIKSNSDADMIMMFDGAFRQQPTNEELGAQTFFANVRTGRWKEAQQVSVYYL